jgi:Luciferase-like monooxygenase
MTEHHFLEEYCTSAAPEVVLAAAAARTKNIRLGHGIVQMPPAVNHPARVAERISTLDVVSDGRVEFGHRRPGVRLRDPGGGPGTVGPLLRADPALPARGVPRPWPSVLGAVLKVDDDGKPGITFDKERFTMTEAMTYFEYRLDTALRAQRQPSG